MSAGPSPTAARRVGERYDAVLFDLDGVVYRGDRMIASAPAAIDGLRGLGTPVVFLTNNSSRTREQVAEKLTTMGVRAGPEEVVTSGLATADMLERQGMAGCSAFVIGEAGVREALGAIGVTLLDGEPSRSDLVVVGWDRSVDYAKLRTASLLVERGALLVGTNADASYPAPDGLWPGAGAILSAVTTTTGATATIAGKPARPMFEAASRLASATHPLVVGDRLDTDIAGASAMGWDSMLVLSGASTPPDLLRSAVLPAYLARDLSAVLGHAPAARFRPASPADADALVALVRSAGLSVEGIEERLAETIVSDGQDLGGAPSITATACLQRVEGFGILRSVAVHPNLRGCGLGMLATAAACLLARDRGIAHVTLFTETAAPFFRELGFRTVEGGALPEPVATSRHAAEECASTGTAMVLEL